MLTSRENVTLPIKQINLGGLEPEEARELAIRLGLELEPSALDRLLARADGNPMLLRIAAPQLLEHKTDAEAFLERLESQTQVASYLLGAMLHDLSSDAQWLISLLSVFRQPVDLYEETLVEAIQKSSQLTNLNAAVMELQRRYLIENARHAYLHPLVSDFLLASLAANAPLRKHLHRLAARWLEGRHSDLVESAFHWMRAGELEQAAEVIGDQGDALFQRGQAKAAVAVVEETIERVARKRGDTTNLRRSLLTARGDLLRGTFRAAEAEASYREALSLAQGQPTVRAGIVRSLAYLLLQRGQPAEALRLCQSASAELSPDDIVQRARLASIESRGHLVLSHYEEAERIATEAIALANQFAEALPLTADDVWARSERTLGWINYTRHPEGDESLVHYRRALECARRAGLRVIECAILSNTATALNERGDADGAQEAYQQALQGYEALGDMYGAAGILHNLGVALANREDYEAALARFEQASEIERRIGDWEGLLSSESARASALMALGKVNEARVILDKVLIEGRDSTDLWAKGTCLCLLTEAQLLQGEIESARASAQQALSMPGIEENARIRSWAQSDLALVQLGAGEFAAAQATMASPPPEDLGFELTSRWQLTQSAVALVCGETAAGQRVANEVLKIARQKKLTQLSKTAESIVNATDLSPANLARLILLG
jgi:ATP/maltotriose-dependent transcriptional regulator MalT